MDTIGPISRHLSTYVDRPARQVYDYASDPAHLPEWASGLGSSIEFIDGEWVAEAPMGRVVVSFAPRNEHGVLDHWVTPPSGETFYNPMRVTTLGSGCEVVFSLRRSPGMDDEDFERDANAVLTDLRTLKRRMERG
ncbi:SRPBCC family protein [Plantactinospora siamensis]|uniref:SRPBCC family protein n=1 Tax=Plantactinospora siamensis TaxID=555372 RepID=A0ABV6NTH9_9ACTN